MMVRKMTSTPCQSYLTVVFLLVIIAVQCTCNLLEDLDMERYDQDYKRSNSGCKSCTTVACARVCAIMGKRSFTLDNGPESQDKYVPRITSDSCLLDSFFRSLSEEGKERIIKAFLESE